MVNWPSYITPSALGYIEVDTNRCNIIKKGFLSLSSEVGARFFYQIKSERVQTVEPVGGGARPWQHKKRLPIKIGQYNKSSVVKIECGSPPVSTLVDEVKGVRLLRQEYSRPTAPHFPAFVDLF